MIGSKIVIGASKKVFGWFAKRWQALVMPDETIKAKQLDNLDKAVSVIEKLEASLRASEASLRASIDWKIKAYLEMGVTKTKVREKLLPEIESSTDPLSVIMELKEKGAIQVIAELPSDETTPPKLPEPEEEEEDGKETDDDNDPDLLDAATD